ncbi:hypothetical protein ACWKWU_06130 [Chitinophaga lutea]
MNKRTIHTAGRLLALSAALLLLAYCAKDGGYHEYTKTRSQVSLNTYDYLKSQAGTYDSMVKVIDRLSLVRAVKSNKLTVMALTNSSFAVAIKNLNILRKSNFKDPVYLDDLDINHLDTLFCRYMMPGLMPTDSLLGAPDGKLFNSLKFNAGMNMLLFSQPASGLNKGGPQYITFSDTKGSFYISKWARTNTSSMDTYTLNGIVHVITPDHEFGFNEFISRFKN